jgi:hypothetical protein
MKTLIIVFSILLTSCSNEAEKIQNTKTIYWQEQVSSINHKKPNLKDVQEEYAAFNPKYDLASNTITIVENVELNNLVCKSWHYKITVKGNDLGYVESATLSEAGVCL